MKNTAGPVDIGVLAKMRAQLARRPAGTVGLAFSRSGFTRPAVALASYFAPQTVLLWSGSEVGECLHEQSISAMLLAKYRECVEEGGPRTPLPAMLRP